MVPGLTKSYGSYTDPPAKEIPVCTLKNFPNQIQHTLAWGRDAFEEHFVNDPSEVNTLLKFLVDDKGELCSDVGGSAMAPGVSDARVSSGGVSGGWGVVRVLNFGAHTTN